MDNLDVKYTVDDVKYDVTNSYTQICILIGKHLIDTGKKDGKLVDIAGKLLDVCELMGEYRDEREY